jgi:hypothetical protein
MSDKLQFVVAFGSGRVAKTSDKLKFVGHFQRPFALLSNSPAVWPVGNFGTHLRLKLWGFSGHSPRQNRRNALHSASPFSAPELHPTLRANYGGGPRETRNMVTSRKVVGDGMCLPPYLFLAQRCLLFARIDSQRFHPHSHAPSSSTTQEHGKAQRSALSHAPFSTDRVTNTKAWSSHGFIVNF